MTTEPLSPTNLVKAVMLEASKMGARLFRRNVGMGWIGEAHVAKGGETVRLQRGDVVIKQGRPFHNGEPGQSDAYGWRTVTITQAMVGKKIAQHVEIECKTGTGRESPEQASWGGAVERSGGVYGVARDPLDVRRFLSVGR